MERVGPDYGFPTILLTDEGSNFTAKTMQDLFKYLKMNHKTSILITIRVMGW